ncbi:hypothetical protein EVAR_48777_1 [Eumeta japonica]|uniref:Uncharacterized protein n=1 Tax=Eumeta variegata TaxID=151549 RepID=A0A4C1Y2K8_EUMVA|nr:hypothetical protein EVAR_48777_1 [Eumeta japonica]
MEATMGAAVWPRSASTLASRRVDASVRPVLAEAASQTRAQPLAARREHTQLTRLVAASAPHAPAASFPLLASHMRFVREHLRIITRV